MGFFHFRKTPDNRGVGTGDIAVDPISTLPIYSIYGPRRNVMHSFRVTGPALFKATQLVPIVPIEGNGAYIAGQFALQSLANPKGAKA